MPAKVTERSEQADDVTDQAAGGGHLAGADVHADRCAHPGAGARRWAGTGFLGGLASGWKAFLAAGGGLSTAFGVALPFLVLLGLLAGAWSTARRLVRGRRAPTATAPDGA